MTNYDIIPQSSPELANFGLGDDTDMLSAVVRTEDGEVIDLIGIDGGEPEDQLLMRDWAWVADALNNAYDRGRHDGIDEGISRMTAGGNDYESGYRDGYERATIDLSTTGTDPEPS